MNVDLLPPPVNDTLAIPSSNYSIAIAPNATRAWWMSDRFGMAALLTWDYTNVAAPLPSQVNIVIQGDGACPARGFDRTPWVNADGTLLLFRTIELNTSSCSDVGLDSNDLYAVPLGPSGQPSTVAVPLTDVNNPGWDDTDPSMSADACWLYFASDEGSPQYEYDVFRAPRE